MRPSPHNSRNLLHFPTPLKTSKVYESRPYFSSYPRVGRTRLSDAFDLDLNLALDLDTDSPGDFPTPRHPERSMRIRLTNPHAQSKDPYPATRDSDVSGSSPRIVGRGEDDREGHESTRAASPAQQGTRLQPLRPPSVRLLLNHEKCTIVDHKLARQSVARCQSN
jgi:hypothetical protein